MFVRAGFQLECKLIHRLLEQASQLSERESIESVPAFLSKLDKYRPK
jgi:hypothetical protein